MRDSGQLVHLIHQALVAAGVDVTRLSARLGYDATTLPRELRTQHEQQAFFWATVEAHTGDPEIGLHLCPHLPPYRGEVIEYLFFSSPTFREGIQRALKYIRLVSDAMSVRMVEDAKGARIVLRSTPHAAPQLRHTEICSTYGMMNFSRSVTEGQFTPLRVRLCVSPRGTPAEYAKVFGCPVEFGAEESEIWFDPALLEYRSPRFDPDLLKLHEDLAEKRLSNLHRQDLIERIRQVFAQRLELEQVELEDVAKELGLAPRRLRFELTRAGTSFSQLLASFRFALAKRLLRATDEPIENIVYLTGFSEPSTFYRAFRRWAGMTPVQFREKHKRPAA